MAYQFSDAHRAAVRAALARRRPTISLAEKRRVSQNSVVTGSRSTAVLLAAAYASAVIEALTQKV